MTADLIEAHLPLVRSVVYQVTVGFPPHVDHDELAAAGNLGLVEAAARFDPTRGPFHRFAAARIRGAVLDACRSMDWAPRSVRRDDRRVAMAERNLAARGRPSSEPEVAEALGVTGVELARMRDRSARSRLVHLDVRPDPDKPATLGDLIPDRSPGPDVGLEQAELDAYLADAVRLLPRRHRTVTVGYFLQRRPSHALAEALGVTDSRVSQLRGEACRMLRDGIDAQYRDRPAPTPELADVSGRRRHAYATAIAAARACRDRLDT